jgi:BirA family biotin operon repressor/biotin-[acetyl-CoA-carboxylase] ligase
MLMFSALLRDIDPDKAPLVSLAAGVAVARALGDDARLKWPNDVRIAGRKVCGIIGELASDYLVIGIGVNAAHEEGELPGELEATSLLIARGSAPRRDDLCVAILRELDVLVSRGDWISDYRTLCETIGAKVRVDVGGRVVEGKATDVDDDGTLIVDGERIVAGDVVHVRDA